MNVTVESNEAVCGSASRTSRIIAIDEKTGKLAVVRKQTLQGAHDYVEFYNVLTGWLAIPELVVCPENGSIEHAMFVADGELMTSHANGSICFIDPHNVGRVKRIQVAASTIWAACDHPVSGGKEKGRVALVSHSSILYFYDVVDKLIVSSISLGVESRLFDVHSNGILVAIGSIDGIIIAGDGKVQRTLKLDRENRRDPTIAWSVLFWKEDLLACGDSRGNVTLWNPLNGALIQSVACMQSHILTMCIAEGALNVAGVDPRITAVKQLENDKFEVVQRRNGPVRDVRKLATYNDRVYASGEDFEIYVGKDGCRPLIMQWQNNVRVRGNMIATSGENYIDVWWKEEGEDEPVEGSSLLPQHHRTVHFAKIFSPKKNIITCWSMSDCGSSLALSTSLDTTVYKLDPKRNSVKKLKFTAPAATAIHVSSEKLITCKGDFEITQRSLYGGRDDTRTILEQAECGSVTKLSVSPCQKFASIITSRSQVFVVNIENGESRLAKVDLPIDVCCTSQSVYVLSTQEALVEHSDHKKVLFEVVPSNGSVKKSATSSQLKMVPSSPHSTPALPVALSRVDDDKIVLSDYQGHWSLVDTVNNKVIVSTDARTTAHKKNEPYEGIRVVGARRLVGQKQEETTHVAMTPKKRRARLDKASSNDRIVVLRVRGDKEPTAQAFKLRKFGMQ